MRVFVSGSTGYVGSRLIPALLHDGHEVMAGMRDPARAGDFSWGALVTPVAFDISDKDSLRSALDGVEVAYYLVHSMAGKDFRAKDAQGAEDFAAAAETAQVRQIVYLSGLIPDGELSEHLTSRLEVEQILLASATPTRVLRAAIVLGAGSTSFELVRRLVERLPILPIPTWLDKKVQPVATEDVVKELAASMGMVGERNNHEDLGGPDVLSYPAFVAMVATELGLTRRQVRIPLLPEPVVGWVVAKITGIPSNTCQELLKSLRHDMVCGEAAAADAPRRLPVREATRRALDAEHTGTLLDGDLQTAAASDPEWTGGEIEFDRAATRPGRFARLSRRGA